MTVELSKRPVLITTFRPWRAHQRQNSSEELVRKIRPQLPADCRWMTSVPVNFETAAAQVIAELHQLMPRAVICCGMAEKRAHLSIECCARYSTQTLFTPVDAEQLLTETWLSELSFDAGRYVCNHLYYEVLKAICDRNLPIKAIFLHIPPLTPQNTPLLAHDFCQILNQF